MNTNHNNTDVDENAAAANPPGAEGLIRKA